MTRDAIFFGPSPGSKPGNRFDAPNGEYRVLYASERLEGAFVETVLRRPRGRILRPEFVNERAHSNLRLERPLNLAKVYDEGLQAFGVDAGELGADDHTFSRSLALSIHAGLPGVHGLAYRSRYNNGEICYALFDRVAAADLTPSGYERFDASSPTIMRLMALHRAVFDTSAPIPVNPPRA
ncbi:MAG: RES domain-containing protein [Acetobacteraceae bacterium]|nr:RES domain-containing protein [Acetobacteraceae bacterium]